MYVLARKNTMIYSDGLEIKIKSNFKTFKIKHDGVLLNTIYSILKANDQPIEIQSDNSHFIKALKLLNHCGSVVIINQLEALEYYKGFKWFDVVLQFSQPQIDLLAQCKNIESKVFTIDPLIPENFISAMKMMDLKVATKGNFFISTSTHCKNFDVLLTFDEKVIRGFYKSEPLHDYSIVRPPKGILNEIYPFYSVLFVLKSILGSPYNAFIINETCSYEEYVMNQDFFESVPTLIEEELSNPTSGIDQLNAMNSFFDQKFFPIKKLALDENYANYTQLGFSICGFKHEEDQYIYVDADYESAQLNGTLKALEYFYNSHSRGTWLATTPSNYQIDKVNFFMDLIEEAFLWYRLDLKRVSAILGIEKYLQGLNLNFEIYLKYFLTSRSYKVYLVKEEVYSDDKKTHDYLEKVRVLIFNLIFKALNSEASERSLIKKMVETLPEACVTLDEFTCMEKEDYIEHATALFNGMDIKYEEYSSQNINALMKAGIILRKIEVKTYHGKIV